VLLASGCAVLHALGGGGVSQGDGSWPFALQGAATIGNPVKGIHDRSEQVGAQYVDFAINSQSSGTVRLIKADQLQTCFGLTIYPEQAEHIISYDLLLAAEDDKRTISEIEPALSNGAVGGVRRRTKIETYRDPNTNLPIQQEVAVVDYSVCFGGPTPIQATTATLVLRGTNSFKRHGFAVFHFSRLG
jgi:hypothetical protein